MHDDDAMRPIAHRAPEAADQVIPVSTLMVALEAIEALETRLAALTKAAGGKENEPRRQRRVT
jgi:hypothetical protein